MKFYHIMMFMIIFNMSIFIVDNLHIYNMSGYRPTDPNYNPSSNSFYTYLASMLVFGALGGIASATIISYFTKTQSDAGIVYGIMSTFFWSSATGALSVISQIAESNAAITMLMWMFFAIFVLIWAAGLMQMVRGGWRTYE